jgi:hypothetical protein
MTDEEMLKLAAKAAGIEWLSAAKPGLLVGTPGDNYKVWNPLTDDGDALRLAVALNIWPVRQSNRPTIVVQNGAAYYGELDELASEPIGYDVCAAVRRAVVRAAAEIGKRAQ